MNIDEALAEMGGYTFTAGGPGEALYEYAKACREAGVMSTVAVATHSERQHLAKVYAPTIMAALIGRWDNYLDSELVVRASALAEKLAEEMVP